MLTDDFMKVGEKFPCKILLFKQLHIKMFYYFKLVKENERVPSIQNIIESLGDGVIVMSISAVSATSESTFPQ
jgi:hypothetical protein